MYSVFLSSFSINLLAFYHEWRPLIGYATHVLRWLPRVITKHTLSIERELGKET